MLNLVRIRLWLALLTMGVVPLAVASALLYATLDSQSLGKQVGVRAATVSASARLATRLDLAAGALRVLASDRTLRELLAPTDDLAYSRAMGHAERTLRAAGRVVGDSLRGAWLVDARGLTVAGLDGAVWRQGGGTDARVAAEVDAQVRRADDDRIVSALAEGGRLVLGVRLPTAPGQVGVLRFELALDRLLAGAMPDQAGRHVLLVGPDGRLLAISESLGNSAAGPTSSVADLLPDDEAQRTRFLAALTQDSAAEAQALNSDGWVFGRADIGASVGGRWSLIVLEPVAVGLFPVHLVGLVLVLGGLLLVLTFIMARQIVRPAEELEKSRTEIHRLYEIARADSLRDALTGLGNHRGFQEELDRQLEWYRRYKVPVSLLLIDVDDLKLANDSEGHGAGDDLLREMGRLIAEVTRYADRSFRIGGDEFAILMPHTDAEGALQVGQRLLDRATQKRAVGRPIPFSGGVSSCPSLATTRSQLYAQADAALYWCKRHGRAAIDIFDPVRDRQANHEATSELSALIARVASQGLLRAAYQPIVDLSNGHVIGFEGLIRPQPESGFADPSSMFAAAESVGRTVELDQACVETVVREARGLAPHQLLSINLSPRFVEAPHFSADALLTVFARYGMDPTRVIVELTERENVEDVLRLQRNLAALQRAGVRVAADDVGAGNAGLRLLSQFRFDIVKIDLMLVQDGTQRDSSRAVLRSLRELASRWGAFMIAEGLETVSQLRAVKELGIAAGQGFLLSRPMPLPNLTRVDLRTIEAGGVVLQVRSREYGSDVAGGGPGPAAAPQPGTP